jgi:hypothetical protein
MQFENSCESDVPAILRHRQGQVKDTTHRCENNRFRRPPGCDLALTYDPSRPPQFDFASKSKVGTRRGAMMNVLIASGARRGAI